MQLIVLGIVPGTNIQMTFQLLFNVAAALAVLFLLARLYSRYIESLPSFKITQPKSTAATFELAHKQLARLLIHNA